jgi:short-subunit dehydrogenase
VELAGKTALLTGATGGLGRAIAAALAGRGANVVLSSRSGEQLERLAASLPGTGHRALVADLAAVGAAARLAADAGAVDVLVANAGLPASGRLESFTAEEIERALRVNLEAPIQLARALIEPMRERDSGHLVFITSLSGKAATARQSLYSATKFGLRGFALGLRQDLWGSPIGISLVAPGFVREAGMFADSGARAPRGLGTTTPDRVGAAVVAAIEGERAEVDVAPLLQRRLAGFAHWRPHLAARLSSAGAAKVGDRVARGQAEKR